VIYRKNAQLSWDKLFLPKPKSESAEKKGEDGQQIIEKINRMMTAKKVLFFEFRKEKVEICFFFLSVSEATAEIAKGEHKKQRAAFLLPSPKIESRV
jgi:hypothetical protein